MTSNETPLRLLALDGGGIRGLSELLILKRIMFALDQRVDPAIKRPLRPCDYFDLIAGTSTGGLIAIMLGELEMDVDTCIGHYLAMAPLIFPTEGFISRSIFGKIIKGVMGTPRFDAEKMEVLIKELVSSKFKDSGADTIFDAPKGNSRTSSFKVFLCTTNADTSTGFLLRNYPSTWEPGTGCTIWQAARATSAAPTFFPPIRFGTPPQNWVDGGLRQNNPVRIMYDEARRVWPTQSQRKVGSIISIGAGDPPLQGVGKTGAAIIAALVRISTDTKQTAREFRDGMEHLAPSDNIKYFRLNAEHGVAQIGLEEWKHFDQLTGATNDYLNDHKRLVEDCALSLSVNSIPAVEINTTSYKEEPTSDIDSFDPFVDDLESVNRHLNWLKFPDSSAYYNQAHGKHTKDTGQWFLRREFHNWQSDPRSFLWLYGKAGSGKTILSSIIITEIKEQNKKEHLGALAYFYFSFLRNETQAVEVLQYSLLVQLVQHLVKQDPKRRDHWYIPEAFRVLYIKNQLPSMRPTKQDLNETLYQILAECKTAYIVIDALDECQLETDRPGVLEFLTELSRNRPSNTHILVTSRQEEDIAAAITGISNHTTVPIQNNQVDLDIKRHIEHCLLYDPQFKGKTWSEELKRRVVDQLTSKAAGVFRWVDCQMTDLKDCKREKEVNIVLNGLPKDLDETYARMLKRIQLGRYRKEAWAVLQWLACSKTPLKLSEVAEVALIDPTQELPFNPEERFGNPTEVLDILAGLVVLSEIEDNDDAFPLFEFESESSRTSSRYNLGKKRKVSILDSSNNFPQHSQITFAHYSVQEYLLCNRVNPDSFRIIEREAVVFILQSCLAYISYYDSSSASRSENSSPQIYPLLRYSCQFWPYHLRMVSSYSDEEVVQSPFWKHIMMYGHALHLSCKVAFNRYFREDKFALTFIQSLRNAAGDRGSEEYFHDNFEFDWDETSSLHEASYIGKKEVVRILLDGGSDARKQLSTTSTGKYYLDSQRRLEMTPLHCAVLQKHQDVVKLLLERGAAIDARVFRESWANDVRFGKTALHFAAENGNVPMVELLLNMGADINADYLIASSWKSTSCTNNISALDLAERSGHSEVVELLIKNGASPHSHSEESYEESRISVGQTALHIAAQNGHVAVCRLLIERGADVNAKGVPPSEHRL